MNALTSKALFIPEHPVYQKPNGQWTMALPNAEIALPGRPAWLQTLDRKNEILQASSEPERVKEAHDSLMAIAQKSYDASSTNFAPEALQAGIAALPEADLKPLVALFQESYKAEMQSTHRVGGAMAGARCSQMRVYTEILGGLHRRLSPPA